MNETGCPVQAHSSSVRALFTLERDPAVWPPFMGRYFRHVLYFGPLVNIFGADCNLNGRAVSTYVHTIYLSTSSAKGGNHQGGLALCGMHSMCPIKPVL